MIVTLPPQTDPGPAPDGGQWDGAGTNTQANCNCGAAWGTNHTSACASQK